MSRIAQNLAIISEKIRQATQQCGRNPDDIRLLGVSKTRSLQDIREAHAAGLSSFAESYLQEALPKISSLSNLDWHFIGPIQSNKTRQIAENFSWVHSVDRVKIAIRLSEQRPAELSPLNICIQVNLSMANSQSGLVREAVREFALQIVKLPRIRLRGLMTIGEKTKDPRQQRAMFAKLHKLLSEINQQGLLLDTLSMGMSDDFEAAIMEGSTILRVGTGVFGSRGA